MPENTILNTIVKEGKSDLLKQYLPNKTVPVEEVIDALDQIPAQLQNATEIQELLIQHLIDKHDVEFALPEKQDNLENNQLIQRLFYYAVTHKKFTTADNFLKNHTSQEELLNQKNKAGKPLLLELFDTEQNDAFEYLMEKEVNLNQKDQDGNTLVNRVTELKLLNKIAEKNGDFSPLTNKKPGFLFDALKTAKQYPAILKATLKASSDLLIKSSSRTIFETLIINKDFETLVLVLGHVKTVVIEQQLAMRNLPTQIANAQLINCAVVLDHCLSLLNSENPAVIVAFEKAKFTFVYNQNHTGGDEFYFNQGLLRFLSLYYFDQKFSPPSEIVFNEIQKNIITELKLDTMSEKDIAILIQTDLYKHHPMVMVFHLTNLIKQAETYYLNQIRKPNIAAEELRLQREIECTKIEKQKEEDEKTRKEANSQVAYAMLNNHLPEAYIELLQVLQDLAFILNKRDDRKFNLNLVDALASTALFITVIVYSLLGIANHEDEAEDGYPNVENACFWLGIYYAEFILTGCLNGLFATNVHDWNDRELKFYHLPRALQDTITRLYTTFNSSQLPVEIDQECNVTDLIENIFTTLNRAKTKMHEMHNLINNERLNVQAPTQPDLRKFTWKSQHKDNLVPSFMLYCCILVFFGLITGIEVHYKPKSKDSLAYRYALTVATYPGYLLGLGMGEFARYLTVLCKRKIDGLRTTAPLITPQFNRHTNIEMVPLTNNQGTDIELGLQI